jgi:hypothetical protein
MVWHCGHRSLDVVGLCFNRRRAPQVGQANSMTDVAGCGGGGATAVAEACAPVIPDRCGAATGAEAAGGVGTSAGPPSTTMLTLSSGSRSMF